MAAQGGRGQCTVWTMCKRKTPGGKENAKKGHQTKQSEKNFNIKEDRIHLCWLQLYTNCEIIALENRANGNDGEGEVDPVWDFLYNVTSFLCSEGMSSNKSGQEGLNPSYYIRIREW